MKSRLDPSPVAWQGIGDGAPPIRLQDAHDQVVVPFASDKCRLPLAALDGEAAFLVAADGPGIVGEHAGTYPMQCQLGKGVGQHEAHSLAAVPTAEQGRVEEADGEAGAPIL